MGRGLNNSCSVLIRTLSNRGPFFSCHQTPASHATENIVHRTSRVRPVICPAWIRRRKMNDRPKSVDMVQIAVTIEITKVIALAAPVTELTWTLK